MPTQMPRSGVPVTARAIGSRHGAPSAVVAEKWPTPGTIRPAAPAQSPGVAGTVNSAPSAVSAFLTDVRLPAP